MEKELCLIWNRLIGGDRRLKKWFVKRVCKMVRDDRDELRKRELGVEFWKGTDTEWKSFWYRRGIFHITQTDEALRYLFLREIRQAAMDMTQRIWFGWVLHGDRTRR